jgi:squalene cyclase
MDPEPQAQARDRRRQQFSEPLLDNSSLRDALDDDQAQQLLDWGLAAIAGEVERTLNLSDERALPRLEDSAGLVRQIMRQVNDLVDNLPQLSETDSWTELLLLSERLRRLQSTPEEKLGTARETIALGRTREQLDRDAVFTHLMNMLQGDGSA